MEWIISRENNFELNFVQTKIFSIQKCSQKDFAQRPKQDVISSIQSLILGRKAL